MAWATTPASPDRGHLLYDLVLLPHPPGPPSGWPDQGFQILHPVGRPFFCPTTATRSSFPARSRASTPSCTAPPTTGTPRFGDIFYATSSDLINWGNHHFVFGKTSGWQMTKVGAGPTPIETKDGWVVIYHGVHTTCNGIVYSMGGAILDLNEPWKVKYRTRRYMMAPTELYERRGSCPMWCSPPRPFWTRRPTGSTFTTGRPTPVSRWPPRTSARWFTSSRKTAIEGFTIPCKKKTRIRTILLCNFNFGKPKSSRGLFFPLKWCRGY